jgi:hypothetical protein
VVVTISWIVVSHVFAAVAADVDVVAVVAAGAAATEGYHTDTSFAMNAAALVVVCSAMDGIFISISPVPDQAYRLQ